MSEPSYEVFSDPAYFDLWCVRPIGNRTFGDGFHVASQQEAEALKSALESIRTKALTDAIEAAHSARNEISRYRYVDEIFRDGHDSGCDDAAISIRRLIGN